MEAQGGQGGSLEVHRRRVAMIGWRESDLRTMERGWDMIRERRLVRKGSVKKFWHDGTSCFGGVVGEKARTK